MTELEQLTRAARERCLAFARTHGLTFTERGEVGIGRPCVGLLKGSGYVEYNPSHFPDFEPIAGLQTERFPLVLDAYHKHPCLAVLVFNENYDRAVRRLGQWIERIEARPPVRVVEYETGATGLQAFVTGVTGTAIVLGPVSDDEAAFIGRRHDPTCAKCGGDLAPYGDHRQCVECEAIEGEA